MGESRIMDKLQKFPPGKKLIIPLSLLGLLVVGGTAIYAVNQSASKPETTETVAPRPIKAVTALGRIEPQGEIIKLSPPPDLGGAKIARLLVEEGDRVTQGQTIAILDSQQRTAAAVESARQDVRVAEADLAIVKAGAKKGEINAQAASVKRVQAELSGQIAANEAEVAQLQAQLRTETGERQASSDRLQAELRNAESEFKRYERLAKQGVISESELDSRRLTVDTAGLALTEAKSSYNRTVDTLREQVKQAQAVARQNKDTLQEQIIEAEATLDSVAEVRDVDVFKAQAEVDRAIAALKQAEADFELTSVESPINGQVVKINAYPGELVNQDDGVVELGQTERMIVVAEVYESDISKVKVGQTATIRSETGAFPDEITGKVSQIGLQIGKRDVLDTDPAADVDSRVVEVKIRLDREASDRVSSLTNSKAIVKINL
jgi:HlyD family secretion protein